MVSTSHASKRKKKKKEKLITDGIMYEQASRPHPPKAILDLFGFKYLRDPFYHTASNTLPPAGAPAPPSADFIERVVQQIPPPTAAPAPFGPNGPDLSTPRGALSNHIR